MQRKPRALSSWFALNEPELLEQRIQGLNALLLRSCLVALLVTAAVSLLVFPVSALQLLLAGAGTVLVMVTIRSAVLHQARHLTSSVPDSLARTEWIAASLTLLIYGYVGYLIGRGPAVAGAAQVTLIAVGLFTPLIALRSTGTSQLVFAAVTIPMIVGAAFALWHLVAPLPPSTALVAIAGFVIAALAVLEHALRELNGMAQVQRSHSRERSLMSQKLALFSTSQLGIAQTTQNGLEQANGRFRQWFGEGTGDMLQADLAAAIGLTTQRLERLIKRANTRIRGHESRTVHILLNGSTPRYFSVQVRRFDPSNPDRGLLWTVSDQTSDWLRRQANERAATRDPLTGALNRRSLHKRMSDMLARDLRRQPFGVLCVDINRFGELNNANGEGFGDQILCIVTRRLQRMLREQDVIARTGGNEFVLVLENVNGMERATQIAEKVMETLSAPIVLTSMTCSIAAAVGVAVAPVHGRRTDEILGRARASMFAIKRTMVQVHNGKMGRRSP